MKKTQMKSIIGLLMAVCLLLNVFLIPMDFIASAEQDGADSANGTTMPTLVYSEDSGMVGFDASAPIYDEACGSKELSIIRAGEVSAPYTATVKVYDNSAEYGNDYALKYKGNIIEKIEGSTSIFNAFRDNGVLSSNLPVDAAEVYVAYGEADLADTDKEVNASDMLYQIEDIGALVAEFEVAFGAGEAKASLTVELTDDEESEYSESFMLVLIGRDGNVIENTQILCAIEDDEEVPSVHIEFDAPSTIEASEETGIAQVEFRRSGNLATGTSALLLQNETPIGYVDFSPYQDKQVVLALPGTYRLVSDGNYTVGEGTVTVQGDANEFSPLPEGADPVLDAVPNEYDSMPQMVQGAPGINKFDKWVAEASKGTVENDDYIIIMGDSDHGLFTKDSSSTDGSLSFDKNNNMYRLNTEGGSNKGYLFSRTTNKYNLNGIASVEGSVYIEDLDTGYCDVIFGVWNKGHHKIYTNDNDSTQNLFFEVADNMGSQYIYYCNSDLKGVWDCGWTAYTPNGFKMTKRKYDIHIMNPDPLSYGDISVAPSITAGSNIISEITMGADRKINISYTCDSRYPARLKGYKLYNGATKQYSGEISLSDSSITFDQAFLDKYDKNWGYNSVDSKDNKIRVFSIVPVFEKIEVEVSMLNSEFGKMTLVSPDTTSFYKGDTLVFTGEAVEGYYFNGVHYQSSKGDEVRNSATLEAIDTVDYKEKAVVFTLDDNCDQYTFQGVFTKYKDELKVEYGDTAPKGELKFEPGVVISEGDYRVSDYFPLMATPNEGYITVWETNRNYYFGDIFNYQLDGNLMNYNISVRFLAEGDYLDPNDPSTKITLSTGKISGRLTRNDCNLLDNSKTDMPLGNTMYTVTTSHGTYTGFTDEDGYYSIDNFTGVLGGTYSMAVSYQNRIGYVTYKYNGAGSNYDLSLPQFAVGGFYPDEVTATVSGQGYNSNTINLTSVGTVELAAKIYVHSDEYKITGVKFHFLSNLNSNYGDELKVLDASLDNNVVLGDKFQLWKLNLSETSSVPENTRMYVSVTAEYTYDSGETVVITTDLVNSGYIVQKALNEDIVPIHQDIPEIPGVQSGSTPASALEIPIIGALDMSFSSKTGGYFVQQGSWKEAGDVYTLVCGHSIQPNYMTGTLKSKYEGAVKTRDVLDSASSGDPKGKAALKQMSAAQFEVAPIFMLKFTIETADNGSGGLVHNITGFEFAIGLDAFICKNVPFNISGVPCYVCVTLGAEAYFQMQFELAEKAELGSELDNIIKDLNDAAETDINAFIAAPIINFGVKGGVGWNGWASVFAEGSISAPFIIGITPLDAAGSISFDIGIGADLMMFTAKISYKSDPYQFGSDELYSDLKTIQQYKNPVAAASYVLSSGESYDTFEEAINNATFSMMARPEASDDGLQSGGANQTVLAEGVFKNTKIQLVKLNGGNIMALFLTDNHAPDGSFNYLSAAYAISSDNGKTWSQIEYIDKNIDTAVSSLQYDINVYELQDRILVTWSEADLDTLLQDMDPDNLTAAQIAKLVNAMNLNGRFFDNESGAPIGEAFVIAENSAVFCGALDAVQNGENVYVYYQRNALVGSENATFESLMNTERTIAMAVANVNDADNWVSVPVRAMNEEGGQYRITEVEPFVHDGVLGEIIVIDRNGRLMSYDYESGEMTPDIEDRQLYLRTYDFDENGTPMTTSFIALSDASECAQSPQVVSNDDYLYLFWNHNGEIVYASDFVAKDTDSEIVRSKALVTVNADGEYTVTRNNKFAPASIDGDESLHVGSTFTVSMSDEGNVLICWVGNDKDDTTLVPTDEIYGIMLETRLVADVISNIENADGLDADEEYQLWAVGSPVALTNEDSPIGALDSICLESGEESKFLLAYTRLNNILRNQSTAADILAMTSIDRPELSVEVEFPEYPMPGETETAYVTIYNDGFHALSGYSLTLSGIGEEIDLTADKVILPGRSEEIRVDVPIPDNFNADAVLNISVSGLGEQSEYTASGEAEVLYDNYFIPTDIPEVRAIPNSNDCIITVYVKNIGNASGTPNLEYINRIYASDSEDDIVTYTYSSDLVVTPNGEAAISFTMTDTLIGRDDYSTVQVRLGDKYDQGTEAPMPKPVSLSIDDLIYDESGESDDNDTSDPETSTPDDSEDVPVPGDSNNNTVYALIMVATAATGLIICTGRKRRFAR